MNISLRPVDEKNFRPVIDLNVGTDQQRFVAPNVRSIAESKIYPYLTPQAIYAGEDLVGFALYGRDPETGSYWIVRLMIDAAQQGKGFGKAATLALLDRLRLMPECGEVFLSFVPDNVSAARLYERIGFERTGQTDESGEIIMRFPVDKRLETATGASNAADVP